MPQRKIIQMFDNAVPLYTGHYTAPSWLPGGNAQTLYPYFNKPAQLFTYRRERWELDDGDFIDVDWSDGSDESPLVVFFHGLEEIGRASCRERV